MRLAAGRRLTLLPFAQAFIRRGLAYEYLEKYEFAFEGAPGSAPQGQCQQAQPVSGRS